MHHSADRVGAGMPAPDFALPDQAGREVRLRDLRGQVVVLAFHPGAWDPSQADQLARFNALVSRVPGSDAELLGITRDGLWCDLTFDGGAVRVPVLADLDPRGSVAARFGVLGEAAVVVIDEAGIVQWRHDGAAPNAEELVGVLGRLAGQSQGRGPGRTVMDGDAVGFGIDARPNRRQFVATALAGALGMATLSAAASAEPVAAALASTDPLPLPPPPPVPVTLRVNGRDVALALEPRVTLLDALREYAGLTATKKGCDHGQCGACTVHVNGRRQLSCLTFAMMHQGDEITTLEGLAQGDQLSPMQAAFIRHDGFQCGYCTPGQIMSATALLREPCGPADADVKECMSGNLCRCGAYPGIVAAIQDVRAHARG